MSMEHGTSGAAPALVKTAAQQNEMCVAKDDTAGAIKGAAKSAEMQTTTSFLAVGQDTSDDDMAASTALPNMIITADDLNGSDRGIRIVPYQSGLGLFCRAPSLQSKERAWYNLDVGRAICHER